MHWMFRVHQVGLLLQNFTDSLGAGGAHGDHHKDHGEHHKAHEDVHAVGQQVHELPGGQGTAHDHVGPQPADEQDAGVHGEVHQRRVPGENLLGGEEGLVDILGGFLELLVLMVLPDVGLHHSDTGDVLLDTGVHVVVLLEDLLEVFHRPAHNEEEQHAQHHHRHQVDTGQLGVDGEGEHHGHQQAGRGPAAHPQDHHVGVLDVGHVGGQTSDQAGGTELVNVGEGIGLNLFKHGLPKVPGQTR